MRRVSWLNIALPILIGFIIPSSVFALPRVFIHLKQVDPSILQEIRYASSNNFVGRPIQGYERDTCILTLPTAFALAKVQHALKLYGFSLKVFDCYRPVPAVNDFVQWSLNPNQQSMKAIYYPHLPKEFLFKLGYIAEKSGHSRGSTVDLTMVDRFNREVPMGTCFDYFDPKANVFNKSVDKKSFANRMFLRKMMLKYGFKPYEKEWWHFTYKKEPFTKSYFNFPVQ